MAVVCPVQHNCENQAFGPNRRCAVKKNRKTVDLYKLILEDHLKPPTLTDLRVAVPLMFQMIFHPDTAVKGKVKGLWRTKPEDWPEEVRFRNPNGTPKFNKKEAEIIYNYLKIKFMQVDAYREHIDADAQGAPSTELDVMDEVVQCGPPENFTTNDPTDTEIQLQLQQPVSASAACPSTSVTMEAQAPVSDETGSTDMTVSRCGSPGKIWSDMQSGSDCADPIGYFEDCTDLLDYFENAPEDKKLAEHFGFNLIDNEKLDDASRDSQDQEDMDTDEQPTPHDLGIKEHNPNPPVQVSPAPTVQKAGYVPNLRTPPPLQICPSTERFKSPGKPFEPLQNYTHDPMPGTSTLSGNHSGNLRTCTPDPMPGTSTSSVEFQNFIFVEHPDNKLMLDGSLGTQTLRMQVNLVTGTQTEAPPMLVPQPHHDGTFSPIPSSQAMAEMHEKEREDAALAAIIEAARQTFSETRTEGSTISNLHLPVLNRGNEAHSTATHPNGTQMPWPTRGGTNHQTAVPTTTSILIPTVVQDMAGK